MKTLTTAYFPKYNDSNVKTLLTNWLAESPRAAVLALVAESNKSIIEQLRKLCTEISIPVIGAFFPELINRGQLENQGFVLAKINPMSNYVINKNLSQSEQAIDQCVSDITELCQHSWHDKKNTLLLFVDAMVPKVASLLDKIYFQLGDSINYMGVNCGSESFKPMSCIFDNEQLVGDAVLAFVLPNEEGAILEHGYFMPNEMIAATSTENNCIVTINGRPAFDVYSELVQAQYGVTITKENFYENAVHFPFGIVRADGEVLVRIPVALQDDGSLFCVGEVPENSVLTLLKAEDAESLATVKHIVEHFSNNPPDNLLTFYCAGRRLHMGAQASEETHYLQDLLSGSNVVGALSLGEIGSSTKDGYPLFHNATLVCTAWGDTNEV